MTTTEAIGDLCTKAARVVEEFQASIRRYHSIGPDYTFKDGTEVFDVGVLLEREDLLRELSEAIEAVREPAP